ncbi:MAG TPA: prepilin-type N-terminal cleavage/methylation domain-containing protein [Gemmatimonadaceae bacterium]|nr:prepilin-type N-terminal cleavage/methylation domain-containing protein [Gemmatimonadaceae bacterium]
MIRPAQFRRLGFTLPEVLVTVAMIGILAAAVVPTVVGQLQKGDLGRMGDDVLAIRGGVEQFASDVRKYPASVGQLTVPITGSMNAFAAGVGAGLAYNASDIKNWKGPYLNKDSVSVLTTAYNAALTDGFVLDTLAAVDSVHTSGGTRYLVLLIPSVDTLTSRLLDALYDDGNTTTGFIRHVHAGAAKDTLKILLMPIQ